MDNKKQYHKEYYIKNKEKMQQYYKEHHKENYLKNKEKHKDYYMNNKEIIINNNLKY